MSLKYWFTTNTITYGTHLKRSAYKIVIMNCEYAKIQTTV